MSGVPDEPALDTYASPDWSLCRRLCDLDPGWILAEATAGAGGNPVEVVAQRSWWSTSSLAGSRGETLQRLWRHSVAVSFAARLLARESGITEPDPLVRAGLLHGLGRWAVAAVDPDWIARWLEELDPGARLQHELAEFGTDLCELGRRLAERWGCDPLVVDSAWLHGQSNEVLNKLATYPDRLSLLQQAFQWAERTPWALSPSTGPEVRPVEPRLRILIAEVQSRCGALFVAPDATSHEERMTRRTAVLILSQARASRTLATADRLLQSLAESDPSETRESWADRAGMLWCAEPEVNAARVIWSGTPSGTAQKASVLLGESGKDDRPVGCEASGGRAPTHVLPLCVRSRVHAEIQLWCDQSQPDPRTRLQGTSIIAAWEAWASRVADRNGLEGRLQTLVGAVRQQAEEAETRTRDAKLAALAEFAAGAGHELNNPLAVIVGRAQLLLGRVQDSDSARSLRIILNQAQRTHRILRDMMFVARPPALRPRACRPADVFRACLASFQDECDARGIRVLAELEQTEPPTWTDPDALSHLAETLMRNAIQATPAGGRITVRSGRAGGELQWSITDSGRGIGAVEGAHLFDPFYCGREAGRGLGLGLSRIARVVSLAGGTLRWSSTPGQGSSFLVQLPLTAPPEQHFPDGKSARDSESRASLASLTSSGLT
jgi:signal transduction histidine kinase